MARDALTAINTRQTPQNRPADSRQVPNSAGGYTFQTSDETQVHRFLTIGTTGGTFYVSERDLTERNAEVVLRAARERGSWLVEQVVAVSTAGRAPRPNPAIFALAAVAGLGDDDARKAALAAIPAVCRTGTHLFTFTTYVQQFRGWGRGLRAGVGRWYLAPELDQLAYSLVKYRQREGWTHADVLRQAHPVAAGDPARETLLRWATHRDQFASAGAVADGALVSLPGVVQAFEQAQATTDLATWVRLIEQYPLSWEMLPDAALGQAEVWKALIATKGMPITALIRQLPRLTRLGVLADVEARKQVTARLTDREVLRRGRVHPLNLLVAQKTYAQGHGIRGTDTWSPVRQVVDALDAAFYASWGTVEPAGKRTLVALDVSGSMGSPAGDLPISCREASVAMALVTLASEPETEVVGFASAATSRGGGLFGSRGSDLSYRGLVELPISTRQRLDDAVRTVEGLPFGGTDCALPMQWATEKGKQFDTMIVLTDNETYAGRTMHPHQALVRYREQTGLNTRLVVVGLASNGFTIADPADPGMIDVAGFDSAVPGFISDFSAGRV